MDAMDFTRLGAPLLPDLTVAEQHYLYFGGTAYLGIPHNKEFIKHYLRGIALFGLNNGTSRTNNIQLDIYNEAEQFAAGQYGAEAALITSSGYLAAQLTVKMLAKGREVRYAPASHPALWLNEAPLIQGSFTKWGESLREEINQSTADEWLIVSNSMNNLQPEIYDFSFMGELNANKNIVLLVDDSHGIGINNGGMGAFASLPRASNLTVIVVASMAKALGVDAGLILSAKPLICRLKESNAFVGASPPAAAGLFAFMHAAAIYKEELDKLNHLTDKLGRELKNKEQWSFIPDFPVFLARERGLDKKLLQQHILISSFPYPDKYGDLMNRIVLSSKHTVKHLQKLITVLNNN